MLKIFRSCRADFRRDAETAGAVYDDAELRRIADAGFNAVWIRVLYRELLANPRYPEFGRDSARLTGILNDVCRRGASCGVRPVIYCQEPFGLPVDDPFWDAHPEMAGASWDYNFGDIDRPLYMRAFCASSPPVREFLRDSSAELLRRVPGTAAVVTITASEFMSHCFSHHSGRGPVPVDCPRCRERRPTEVVADILNDMRAGLDRVNPDVPLIAWNWSWVMYEEDPQPSILGALDPRVHIQADFERGGSRTDPTGREIEINEYSLSYPGPSERFMRIRDAARVGGRPVHAKLQIGTTHELATVSNLPLIPPLFRKARAFRELDMAGFMGCWNFGNMLTLNTRAFNFFLSDACPAGEDAALQALAAREFPEASAEDVLAAWQHFGGAFEYYPFSIPFLYHSPVNYSLQVPLTPGPVHGGGPAARSWHDDPRDPDADLAPCFGPFTPEDITDRLGRVATRWGEGLGRYRAGLAGCGCDRAAEELHAAEAVGLCLRSAANRFRLYLLKRDWSEACEAAFADIARDEIGVLDEAIPLYETDSRQGYHIEAGAYLVTPEGMRAKRDHLHRRLGEA